MRVFDTRIRNDKLEEWRFIAVLSGHLWGLPSFVLKGSNLEVLWFFYSHTGHSLTFTEQALGGGRLPAEWDRPLWTCFEHAGLPVDCHVLPATLCTGRATPSPAHRCLFVWAAYHFGNYNLVVTVIAASGPSSVYRSIKLFLSWIAEGGAHALSEVGAFSSLDSS